MVSLQKESEWEDRFYRLLVSKPGDYRKEKWTVPYVNVSADTLKKFISFAIDTAVSNREKEIAEDVEKKKVPKDLWGKGTELSEMDKGFNQALDEVLSILKHQPSLTSNHGLSIKGYETNPWRLPQPTGGKL